MPCLYGETNPVSEAHPTATPRVELALTLESPVSDNNDIVVAPLVPVHLDDRRSITEDDHRSVGWQLLSDHDDRGE